MSMEPLAVDVPRKIAEKISGFGGFLRCETCGDQDNLNGDAPIHYLRRGWPKCHGKTMRWWTQRQIDAGEVPTIRKISKETNND